MIWNQNCFPHVQLRWWYLVTSPHSAIFVMDVNSTVTLTLSGNLEMTSLWWHDRLKCLKCQQGKMQCSVKYWTEILSPYRSKTPLWMKHRTAFLAPSTKLTIKSTNQSHKPFNVPSPDAENAALLRKPEHEMALNHSSVQKMGGDVGKAEF